MSSAGKLYRILTRLAEREINYYRVKPTNMLAFLTYRCTSRCKSCRMWQRKPSDSELSLAQWKDIVSMAQCAGISNIEMFGGDVLLRMDLLLPLIRWAKECGIAGVDLVTNAYLVDKKTARALVDAGLNTIYVSVDGLGPVHEMVRGVPGSFARVKAGLEFLVAARGSKTRPQIVMNTTVSALNVHGLKELVPFAAQLGVDRIAYEYIGEFPQSAVYSSKIDGIAPQPYYVPQAESLLLKAHEARELKRTLHELRQEGVRRKVKVFTKNIDFLTVNELTSGVLPNKKCYVCRYLVTVDPYGEVLPCPFFNTYSLGNLRDTSVASLWNGLRHRRFIRKADNGDLSLCRRCILSVERNPTIAQEVYQSALWILHKERDR